MRHYYFLFILAAMIFKAACGEIKHFDQNAVPSECKSNAGSLSLSTAHFKSGGQSLQWKWSSNKSTLMISEPNPVAKPSAKAGFITWLYMKKPTKGKMAFDLLYQDKVVGSGWFWMNFRGWRILGANYQQLGVTVGQPVDAIRFNAPEALENGALYLDMFQQDRDYFAIRSPQTPWVGLVDGLKNPQAVVITAENPAVNRPWLPQRKKYLSQQELDEIAFLEKSFLSKRSASRAGLPAGKIEELRAYLSTWHIQMGHDSICGKPIDGGSALPPAGAISIIDYLKACNALQIAWHQAKDGAESDEVKSIYIKLVAHLIDQGFCQGQRLMSFDNYPMSQYASFYAMKDVLVEAKLARPIAQALIDNFGSHNSGDFAIAEPSSSMDGLGFWHRELYACALMYPEATEQYQHLQIAQRFLNLALVHPSTIAADGSVYHHGGFHFAYASYNLPRLLTVLEKVAATRFRINAQAQERLKTYVRAIAFTSSAGEQAYNLGMRAGTPLSTSGVEQVARMLANMGTADGKEPIDKEMASISLRLIAETSPHGVHPNFARDPWKHWLAQGIQPAASPQGFLVMNGAPLAIARRDSWVASISGITPFYRCLEIYGWTQSNNYGRFARNGSMAITSQGQPSNLKESGWNYNGWHWSHFPGTTALRVKSEVDIFDGYAMYGNSQPNVGGTSLDKQGTWCMQHVGYGVNFQKSYFCFENRITSITTGITHTHPDKTWPAVTTLLQNSMNPKDEYLIFDDGTRSVFPMAKTLTFEKDRWFIDNKHTGYYLPAGNDPLKLSCTRQQWRYMIDAFLIDKNDNPFAKNVENINQGYKRARSTYKDLHELEKYYTPSEGDFSLSYLDHGADAEPAAAIYTAVIRTNPEKMAELAQNPAWRILQANDTAHIVHDVPSNTYAHSIFQPTDALPPDSPLLSCDQPCTLMLRPLSQTRLLGSLAFTLGGNAIPSEKIIPLSIKFAGKWKVSRSSIPIQQEVKDTYTILTIRPADNLPLHWELSSFLNQPTE